MPTLPYLPAPGSIKTALERIKTAATPERVTGDFVKTKLQLTGGTGNTILPYLKKIGFVGSDGVPTDIYKKFRNTTTSSAAAADAVRHGYKALAEANEYFYALSDKDLLSLIVQVTGAEADSQVAKLTLSTLKNLKSFADFEGGTASTESGSIQPQGGTAGSDSSESAQRSRVGLNLAYTINLNLPATSDQAVFNAIFRSLKEHLLSED